jgi:hypothetical protein
MLFLFSLLFLLTHSAPSKFQHPGVLVSKTQLDFVKSQISAKSGPIYEAYQKAIVDKYSSKTYKIEGPPADGIIECGSYSNPDIGCSAADSDSAAAYLQAVLWYITGDKTYANNSISILNNYGSKLKGFTDSNAPLQAGWNNQKMPAAAEILKWSNAGWPENEMNVFTEMLYKVVLPHIYPGSGSNGNWEITMIDAMFGIAVFSDNATLYDHSVTFWKQRIPAYFYYHTDGDHPVKAPRGNPSWYNQDVFNTTTDGVCQETCRDLGHTAYGIAGATHSAETAWIQGDNLYQAEMNRLAATLEFHAKIEIAGSTTVPDYVCHGKVQLGAGPTFVVGYNQLHNRLGMNLPNTEKWITTHVDQLKDAVDTHMMVYETMTHGLNA